MDILPRLRDYLREGLASGHYGEGRRIPPERHLANEFGTSRATIRKALYVLELEQMVVRRVGRGTFIAPQTRIDIDAVASLGPNASPSELMAAREVFEPALVRCVVLNATDADNRNLRHLLDQQRKKAPGLDFETADIGFHRALAAATHNQVLIDLSEHILKGRDHWDWRKLKKSVARRKPRRWRQAVEEHERIVAALEDRDADAAAAAMRHHLERVRFNLIGADR